MKTRQGFVANSSSSSYILKVRLPETEEEFFKILYNTPYSLGDERKFLWERWDPELGDSCGVDSYNMEITSLMICGYLYRRFMKEGTKIEIEDHSSDLLGSFIESNMYSPFRGKHLIDNEQVMERISNH